MNLFYLRYFVTLAHVQHYTKAAEQLCITQPSLSHAIMQLEKELGVQLFEKTGRNTTLTRYGEEFLICTEHTLETLDAGVENLQRSARGEGLIRLGFLRPLGVEYVPRLAASYLAEHSDKRIDFTFHTDVTGPLLDGLEAQRFDLLFCSRPPEDMGFRAVPVNCQELVLITPRKHPLASLKEVDLQQTREYPYVFFSRTSGIRVDIDRMFDEISMEPKIAYETEEDQVVAGLVAQGFGIAIVPHMDMLHKLDISIIPITAPAYERNFYMVYDERTYMSPVVRDFMKYVLEKEKMHTSKQFMHNC